MSDERPTCNLCGHLMPKGEEMFHYHGYSGPCPGPPVDQPKAQEKDGIVADLRAEVERLRAALRDVAQHYWWKDETKDLIDELFAEQAGGGE